MSRSRAYLPWLLLCLLAPALLTPAPAAALVGKFTVPASNGYHASVSVVNDLVELQVTRGTGSKAKRSNANYYLARTRQHPNRLAASFGELGKIEMRFQPSGVVTHSKPRSGCFGPDRYTYRHGVFVGSLDFRGEGGFTAIHVRRVKGATVSPQGALLCGGSEGIPVPPQPASPTSARTWLWAGWHVGVAEANFWALREGGVTTFEATSQETSGQLGILRETSVRASRHDFLSDSSLSFATVTPPAPFSGVGEMGREASGARTWSGSLAVAFPGMPPAALTGPPFKTTLSRGF